LDHIVIVENSILVRPQCLLIFLLPVLFNWSDFSSWFNNRTPEFGNHTHPELSSSITFSYRTNQQSIEQLESIELDSFSLRFFSIDYAGTKKANHMLKFMMHNKFNLLYLASKISTVKYLPVDTHGSSKPTDFQEQTWTNTHA